MEDKVTVLVTLRVGEQLIQRLREVSPRLEVIHRPAQTVAEIPPDVWQEVDVLLTWGNVLPDREMASRLRWVQVTSAGVDRLLGNPLFEQRDVILTTTSGIHAVTMAEYALGMMLAFAHHLPRFIALQRAREWPRERDALVPRLLRGATLGIVGYGSIGRELARLARAFGMQVLATKRDAMHPAGLPEYVEPGTGDPEGVLVHRLYPSLALKSMVKDCDYIVVLAPLTAETVNMVNAEVLSAVKPGAVLINMARGGIVDEAALLEALKSGTLGGAAFDVFAEEPLPEDSPLWDAPNLIISPHVAGMMPGYMDRAMDVFVENLRRYLAHQELLNVVDWERGY